MNAARSSTATGTTVTAEAAAVPAGYRGRFAPSPTGLLHIGSLVAALASFLDARANAGIWLVRMEDLDAARVIPGAADEILRCLECLGLIGDEPVLYQSTRREAYLEALATLRTQGATFDCTCTRRELAGTAQDEAGNGSPYPGWCRNGPRHAGPAAIRFRTHDEIIAFDDRAMGRQSLHLSALGDPVICRRDGIPAYQLAVVVDDAWQRITDVVRGADLLLSTGWQRLLQRALGYPEPRHLHVPLVVEPDGAKLAKSRRSLPVRSLRPTAALWQALQLLQLSPPASLAGAPVAEQLAWGITHWRPGALRGLPSVRVQGY